MGKTGVKTRRQNPSEDRISSLPDEILVTILSLLRLKEARKTSVLSKRWINLWMSTIRLDFDATEVLEEVGTLANWKKRQTLCQRERHKCVKRVNEVLKLHKSSVLNEFRITFCLGKSYQKQIDTWLEYCFAREVQRLELNLLAEDRFNCSWDNTCTFPQGLLGLSSGKSSKKHLGSPFDFKSLRALIFRGVNVTGEVVQFFLQNCPLLQHLVVDVSHDLKSVEVSGPSFALKYLELCYCTKLESVTVCNANLVSLKLCQVQNLVLKNVPMLVDVKISGTSSNFTRDVAVSWLSTCLSRLEVLTIALVFNKGNGELLEFPQLTNLKLLTIEAYASGDYSLIGYTSVIRASPNLAKFVLKMRGFSDMNRREIGFKKGISYPLQHLKVVEMSGCCGRISEVELVYYFVVNAIALEKIVIDPCQDQLIGRFSPCIHAQKEKLARWNAKQQLEALIPSHVKLQIL